MSIIVATGVYALLLKFLQKNSPHNVQTNGGAGVKGFLNNVKKKTALFSRDGFPNDKAAGETVKGRTLIGPNWTCQNMDLDIGLITRKKIIQKI